MAGSSDSLDRVLDKLVRDVEQAVHSLYRGDVRQQTAKARTDVHRAAARKALAELLGAGAPMAAANAGRGGVAAHGGSPPLTSFTPGAGLPPGTPLTEDEAVAITRCIMAWLPMGPPSGAAADSRCVPAGKELIPLWADRELAREAARRLSPKR